MSKEKLTDDQYVDNLVYQINERIFSVRIKLKAQLDRAVSEDLPLQHFEKIKRLSQLLTDLNQIVDSRDI